MPRITEKPGDDAARHAPETTSRKGCARLPKRVFDIDLEHCPQCGGELKTIAAIEEPAVIVRILAHLGLPARAPPRAPRSREAVKVRRCEVIRVESGGELSSSVGNFHRTPRD